MRIEIVDNQGCRVIRYVPDDCDFKEYTTAFRELRRELQQDRDFNRIACLREGIPMPAFATV